jgi:hypothetical protein
MEFHENRARQPFIGFVFLARIIKKWWLREQTRRTLQRNERRTAKRCRAASGSDQLKSAIFTRHFPEAALDAPVRATRRSSACKRERDRG